MSFSVSNSFNKASSGPIERPVTARECPDCGVEHWGLLARCGCCEKVDSRDRRAAAARLFGAPT